MPSYFVPLPTAFTDDTSTLSEIRIGRIVKFYAERGASGFVIGGPTGEGHALAIGEKKALFKYAVRSAGDKPVIATFPAITTAMTIDLALEAADAGVKHLVIVPSRHVPLTPTELAMLATVLRRHVTIPVALTLPPGMDELEGVHGVGLPQWDASRLVGGFATGDEFQLDDWICTPFAVLGIPRMERLFAKWDQLGRYAVALLRHGHGARVARAIMEHEDLEVGPPRPPVFILDAKGQQLLQAILHGLEESPQRIP